jgi:hypothetical protein
LAKPLPQWTAKPPPIRLCGSEALLTAFKRTTLIGTDFALQRALEKEQGRIAYGIPLEDEPVGITQSLAMAMDAGGAIFGLDMAWTL